MSEPLKSAQGDSPIWLCRKWLHNDYKIQILLQEHLKKKSIWGQNLVFNLLLRICNEPKSNLPLIWEVLTVQIHAISASLQWKTNVASKAATSLSFCFCIRNVSEFSFSFWMNTSPAWSHKTEQKKVPFYHFDVQIQKVDPYLTRSVQFNLCATLYMSFINLLILHFNAVS